MARVTERLAVLAFAALHRRRDHRARLRRWDTGSASFCYDHRRAAASAVTRESRLDAPPQPRDRTRRRPLAGDGVLDVQGCAAAHRGARGSSGSPRWSASSRRSSARSSTCSSARPSTSRTRASGTSRSRRWRSGSLSSTSAARCAGQGSSRPTSCAPCAPPGSARPARRAGSRSRALWQVCPYCATDIPPGLPSLQDLSGQSGRATD